MRYAATLSLFHIADGMSHSAGIFLISEGFAFVPPLPPRDAEHAKISRRRFGYATPSKALLPLMLTSADMSAPSLMMSQARCHSDARYRHCHAEDAFSEPPFFRRPPRHSRRPFHGRRSIQQSPPCTILMPSSFEMPPFHAADAAGVSPIDICPLRRRCRLSRHVSRHRCLPFAMPPPPPPAFTYCFIISLRHLLAFAIVIIINITLID